MYIDPFVCGIAFTLLAELALSVLCAAFKKKQ